MIDKKKHIEDIARMYAESLVLYGVNITDKWETATSQHMALEHAYMCGQSDAIKRMWIPCSEILPKEYGEYLCTLQGEYDNGISQQCTFHPQSWKGCRWSTCDADGYCELSDEEVIAWMPLPEPYKER